MTSKRALSAALILALLSSVIGTVGSPGRAAAARPASIPLFAASSYRQVATGEQQKIFVHTIALADLKLKVDYGNGQSVTLTGATDERGIHLFAWTAAYTGTAVVLARYWVYVTRGPLYSSARGDFVLFPIPPFAVTVGVLTPRLHVGDTLRLAIHARPGVLLSLHVGDRNGLALLDRYATADALGDWSVSIPVSATLTQEERFNIVVTGDLYGRHVVGTGTFSLRPLPPALTPDAPVTPENRAPTTRSTSLETARRHAQALADGSLAQAQTNAQAAVQMIGVDLGVLAQWTSTGRPHGASYYQGLLSRAGGYNDYIDVTAQALSDDTVVEARMRAVMPHKAVMISLGEQALRAYEDGQLVQYTLVTTGRPQLPTVTGHYAIYEKITPYKFISPWPQGSPFYYPPTWIKYWMPFYSGYGLHDAWWRAHYGPGTNIYGDGAGSGEPTGTHGCVNIPYDKTVWLWNWAPVGTPVVVYGGPHVAAGAAGI